VESEVGVGTVVRVALPACVCAECPKDDVAVEEERLPPSHPRVRRKRVLIVDDEVKLGAAIQKELSAMHEVEFVTSGVEALALLRGGARFDLILCDLVMPSMSGIALHEELQALAPDQAKRMVFLTGGAFSPSADDFLHEVGNLCLEKPFDLRRLHAVVQEALGERRSSEVRPGCE
jgi:CheY-like chemotaxis protein